MKNILLPFTLLFFSWTILFAQTPSTQLIADKRIHDFGEIQEKDGKVSYTFILTNSGDKPIAISATHSGCGCATTSYTKEPVMPGKTGKVTITYNPRQRPGAFSKEITILFNDGKDLTRVWIKGTVIPYPHPVEEDHPYSFGKGLHCSLSVLPFGKVTKGASREIRMLYANDTEQEMTLTFSVEGNHPQITYTDPGKLAPKERGSMKFKYTATEDSQEQQTFHIYPCVNGRKLSKPLVVKVK